LLAYELEKILKEIGEVLEDFEKLVKSGKADFTKTTSYALWAFNRIANQGVIACIGIDGYRIYSIPDNFPAELANKLLSLVCTLLKHQNKLKSNNHDRF